MRHHDNHLPAALLKAKEAGEVASAGKLLDHAEELRTRALGILAKAEAAADHRNALGAIREARGCLELLGKLAGELSEAPTVNIVVMPEWLTLQAAILAALDPYLDARLAVADALTAMESNHAPGHA